MGLLEGISMILTEGKRQIYSHKIWKLTFGASSANAGNYNMKGMVSYNKTKAPDKHNIILDLFFCLSRKQFSKNSQIVFGFLKSWNIFFKKIDPRNINFNGKPIFVIKKKFKITKTEVRGTLKKHF